MKTVNYQIARVSKSIVASLIIMASFAGIAKGVNSNEFSGNEYNAKAFIEAELAVETATWNHSGTETTYMMDEADLSSIKYNAKDFVEAELTVEAEGRINGNDEKVAITETDLSLEVEAYDASKFAEADFAAEALLMINNDETRINVTETDLAVEVEAYDARKFAEAEFTSEASSLIYSKYDNAAELPFGVEAYDAKKFAEADFAKATENWIAQTSIGTPTPGTTNCNSEMASK